jgi:hypothetical protein
VPGASPPHGSFKVSCGLAGDRTKVPESLCPRSEGLCCHGDYWVFMGSPFPYLVPLTSPLWVLSSFWCEEAQGGHYKGDVSKRRPAIPVGLLSWQDTHLGNVTTPQSPETSPVELEEGRATHIEADGPWVLEGRDHLERPGARSF